jgi:cyclic dehypoxanthinyl futalosine synthase
MDRITDKQALDILQNMPLEELGQLALAKRKQLHKKNEVSFIVDRNINYTNICWVDCKFCAFYRHKKDKDAYILTNEKISEKIDELIEIGGTQILFQGGVHPTLKIDYYEDLVDFIHTKYPKITIHGFSAIEIEYISRISKISIQEVIQRLKDKGLFSIPGAGAEILSESVREIIAPKKITTEQWLNVHRNAHNIGVKSTATMMFGSVDTDEDIIEHLGHIRRLQDESGGFRAFILWSFQGQNTKLLEEYPNLQKSTSNRYLRLLALSRLYLDNVANIQSSWVTQGSYIGQIALLFGANDLGSVMMEENVVSSAGVKNKLNQDEMIRLIKDIGFIPVKRNTAYEILERF